MNKSPRYTLIKFERGSKKSFPVGEGWLSKTGKSICCEPYPSQPIKGQFYVCSESDKEPEHNAVMGDNPRKYDVIRYGKDGKSWPVGIGLLTKSGTIICCELFPKQTLKGRFYVHGETKTEPEYQCAADEYDV